MKNLVVYHSADFDGKFCPEQAAERLGVSLATVWRLVRRSRATAEDGHPTGMTGLAGRPATGKRDQGSAEYRYSGKGGDNEVHHW